MLFSVVLFVGVYIFVITEKIHRTVIAVFGAMLLIVFKLLSQDEALGFIDFNTIGLLVGMMIIVGITKKTGIFEYLAIRSAKIAKGDPWRILVIFSLITAVASALLDNVTTILLIVPVTLVITDALDINPVTFVVAEVFMANVGGTGTLIGDPPNIMIGSANNIGFMSFLVNLMPVAIIILVVTLFILKFTVGRGMVISEAQKKNVLSMNEHIAIRDKKLLIKSLIVLVLTILGFMLHESLGYHSATIALIGGAVLLIISGVEPEDIFLEIEWSTIFFFMALFVLVGGLESTGVIERLATKMIALSQGNLFLTTLSILWVSAIASAFLDNIPFVATMIPLIQNVGVMSGMNIMPLWWALALGACLGGNGTIIGASANVIAAGFLSKNNYKISFMSYMKMTFPLMLVSIIISTVYLVVFYI